MPLLHFYLSILAAVPWYKTIKSASEGEFKDRGSKFLGFAFPVFSESDIQNQLEKLKAQHPKATHHCYAWKLGTDGNAYRVNDDGEPSGSAGRPIMGQIESVGLTFSLVVVIRYYGGTKLGVSGLINAYRSAAKIALEKAEVIQSETFSRVELVIAYSDMNDWMQFLKGNDFIIEVQEFGQVAELCIQVPDSRRAEFVTFASSYPSTKTTWKAGIG